MTVIGFSVKLLQCGITMIRCYLLYIYRWTVIILQPWSQSVFSEQTKDSHMGIHTELTVCNGSHVSPPFLPISDFLSHNCGFICNNWHFSQLWLYTVSYSVTLYLVIETLFLIIAPLSSNNDFICIVYPVLPSLWFFRRIGLLYHCCCRLFFMFAGWSNPK